MKINSIKKLMIVLAAGLMLVTTKASANEEVPLIAGQNYIAGTVQGAVEDDFIYVVYATTSDWVITEMHVAVGPNLASLPRTKKGSPQIGNFPYKTTSANGLNYYFFQIPNQWPGAECICIAAHAVVKPSPTAPSGLREETAWAAGAPMGGGSWATYFCVTPEED